jgi:formylglycine-generating enzyme required for sulfatase activity
MKLKHFWVNICLLILLSNLLFAQNHRFEIGYPVYAGHYYAWTHNYNASPAGWNVPNYLAYQLPTLAPSGGVDVDGTGDYGYWSGTITNLIDKNEVYLYVYGQSDQFRSGLFTVGDIAGFEYYTRKGNLAKAANWYLTIYTMMPAVVNGSTVYNARSDCYGYPNANWYCRKLTADLPYSKNFSMQADTWTKFDTDAGTNQIVVYDGSAVNMSSYPVYQSPTWAQANITGFNWANYGGSASNISYNSQYVLFMSIALGSGNTNTTADLDGLKIYFTDGSSYLLDFVATTATAPTISGLNDLSYSTDTDACTKTVSVAIPSTVKDSYGSTNVALTAKLYEGLDQKLVLGTDNSAMIFKSTKGKKFKIELINEGNLQDLSITRGGDRNAEFTVSLATDALGQVTSTTADVVNALLEEGSDLIDQATASNGSSIALISDLSNSIVDLEGMTGTDASISQGQIQNLSLDKGSSAIVWTATNTGAGTPTPNNVTTTTQEILVYDDQLPSFTALSDLSLDNDTDQCSAAISSGLTLSATDNCAGLVVSYQIDSASVVLGSNANGTFSVGTHSILWQAIDADGNTASDTQSIVVSDAQAPILTKPADLQVNNTTNQCSAVINSGLTASASDNCVGAVVKYTVDQNAQVTGTSANGTYAVGSHTIAWTVIDAAGLSDSGTQNLSVIDAQAPVVTIASNVNVNNDAGQCSAVISSGLSASVSDNCAGATLSYQIDGGNVVTGTNAQGTYQVGAHTIKWTGTDSAQLTNLKNQTVTVVDAEYPVLTIDSDLVIDNDQNLCSASISSGLSASVSDNCAGSSISYRVNGGAWINASDASSSYSVGTHTITWKATDSANLSSSQNQSVQVRDVQAPVLTAPSDLNLNNDLGLCKKAISQNISASATDNCPNVVVSYRKNAENETTNNTSSANASGDYVVGANTVLWKATDSSGNLDSDTQNISITDNELPKINSLANRTELANGSLCSANVTFAVPTITDNCAIQTYANDYNQTGNASGTYAILSLQNGVKVSTADSSSGGQMTKTIQITWTASDIYGNAALPMTHSLTLNASDTDADKICNGDDNCPSAYNPSQSNIDGDAQGNACDCGDAYVYQSTISALNQSTYIKETSANANFSGTDTTEKTTNLYAEECDDGNTDNSDACTTACKAGPKIQWIAISGGTYNMGNRSATALANEKPVLSNMTIPNLSIAKHEVTVGQYRSCVASGGCPAFALANASNRVCNWNVVNRENYPMNCIDYTQALAYSTWLGNGARLPNESEWTFVAHSRTTGTLYPWGALAATCTLTHGANVTVVSGKTTISYGCGTNNMVAVCTKGDLTTQGVCDLGGNLSEWVTDPYSSTLTGTPLNGDARSTTTFDARYRTLKGTSWRVDKMKAYNYYRFSDTPGRLTGLVDGYGFRPLKR